jgi:hypothetical protein
MGSSARAHTCVSVRQTLVSLMWSQLLTLSNLTSTLSRLTNRSSLSVMGCCVLYAARTVTRCASTLVRGTGGLVCGAHVRVCGCVRVSDVSFQTPHSVIHSCVHKQLPPK